QRLEVRRVQICEAVNHRGGGYRRSFFVVRSPLFESDSIGIRRTKNEKRGTTKRKRADPLGIIGALESR
ncbi:MAG TPA: hypothetical protein VF975_02065, partial [Thermoanaerobaculia bacterium]